MTQVSQANDLLRRLHERSPTGFAIGLHIQFTTPRYFFQSYSKEWLDAYSAKGFVMNDPIVHWGFSNEGSIRWRDLAQTDPLGVLSEAAKFGMCFGMAASVMRGSSRSIAGFSRGDREMTDVEMAGIHKDLRALHDATIGMQTLSPEIHDTLRQMSIYLTHG
ncbi:MAG: autoinducer binding domain-containing protein [Rhodobacteraceae bacterium]|nr:autoinducer binding domain-containing protein [Paracoccaceae bacterium]